MASSVALTDDWFEHWMPYCFHKLPGIRRYKHVYLPLNRDYKPLGHVSRKRVHYEDYAAQAVIFHEDPMTLEGIWTATSDDKLWLYDDTASRVDYFERLGRLMSHKVRAVGKDLRSDHIAGTYQPRVASKASSGRFVASSTALPTG